MIHYLQNETLRVEISSLGGEIYSIKTLDDTQYIWQGDSKIWKDRAPVLFPIVGRLYGGYYTYKGQNYNLDLHGFIKDLHASVKETEDSLIFSFISDEKTLECYPFNFEFKIIYTLKDNIILQRFEVKNAGNKTMFFALGGHTGFNLPFNESINEFYLEFDEDKNLNQILLNDCFITGEIKPIRLDNRRIINFTEDMHNEILKTLILKDMCKTVSLKSKTSAKSVTVKYPDYKYLAFWKADYNAKFLCIEPWMALSSFDEKIDDLESKSDMTMLKSGNSFYNTITYIIK